MNNKNFNKKILSNTQIDLRNTNVSFASIDMGNCQISYIDEKNNITVFSVIHGKKKDTLQVSINNSHATPLLKDHPHFIHEIFLQIKDEVEYAANKGKRKSKTKKIILAGLVIGIIGAAICVERKMDKHHHHKKYQHGSYNSFSYYDPNFPIIEKPSDFNNNNNAQNKIELAPSLRKTEPQTNDTQKEKAETINKPDNKEMIDNNPTDTKKSEPEASLQVDESNSVAPIKFSSFISKSDLSAEQVLQLQKSALAKIENGDKLSIVETIALTPDVRKMIIDAGLVERQEMDNKYVIDPNTITKLEEERHNTSNDYNIATLPTPNSFLATTNTVRLPIPGGGDIRTPKDLETFGLQGTLNVAIK